MRNSSFKAFLVGSCLMALAATQSPAGWVQQLFYAPIDPAGSTTVASLTNSPSFPNGPSENPYFPLPIPFIRDISQANDPFQLLEGIVGAAENYGAMIQGYLIPPQTGIYTIWLASDDDGQFFLSTDASMANMQLKARVDGWTGSREYGKYPSQMVTNISLTAGQTYYFRILQKDGNGGDNVSLGWRLPNMTLERPIPVKYFQRFTPSGPDIYGNYDYANPVTAVAPTVNAPLNGSAINVEELRPLELFVNVSGAQPMTYAWYKNSGSLGVNLPYFTIPSSRQSDSGTYQCVVSNGTGSPVTNSVFVTVYPDTTAPTVIAAATYGSTNSFTLTFNEPLNLSTATNTANYVVTSDLGSVTVQSAALLYGTNASAVVVTTLPFGGVSTLTAVLNSVRDQAIPTPGNSVATNTTVSIGLVDGAIVRERYDAIGTGGTVINLISAAKYTNKQPDLVEFVPAFDTVSGWADAYGSHMIGLITAPVSGNYTFFLASDDQSVLYWGTDTTAGTDKTIVAVEPSYGNYRDWTTDAGARRLSWTGATQTGSGVTLVIPRALDTNRPANRSDNIAANPIYMEKGKKYYLETLHKEGGGGDYCSVSWRKPGDAADPVNGDANSPIGAQYLSLFAGPGSTLLGPLSITTQPRSLTNQENFIATFTPVFKGSPPFTYQWYRDGVILPDSTGSSYSIQPKSSDSGAVFSVRIRNGFSEIVSSNATLTVIPDTTPPVVYRVFGAPRLEQIVVNFFEPSPIVTSTFTSVSSYSLQRVGGNAVSVSNARILGTNVILTTATPLVSGVSYTLVVKNWRDTALSNNTTPNTTNTFTASVLTRGWLTYEDYQIGVAGNDLASLYNNANYPLGWSRYSFITSSSVPTSAPNVDNFGVILRGFFRPAINGDHAFFCRGDDGTRITLDLPGDPGRVVAERDLNWGGSYRDSNPAGTRYNLANNQNYQYIAMMKDGGGGDFLEATMLQPGETTIPVGSDGTVTGNAIGGATPARFFWSYAPPDYASITITNQPSGTTTNVEGVRYTLTVGATGVAGTNIYNASTPLFYQWQRAQPGSSTFDDIIGQNSPTYQTPYLYTPVDSGAQYRCIVTVPGYTTNTTARTMVFTNDLVRPTIVSAVGNASLTWIQVRFSERINSSDANNINNYTIPGLTVLAAALQANETDVILTTSAQVQGTQYTITVNNIKDYASTPNVILSNSTVQFKAWQFVTSMIKREWFYDIGGGAFANLTNNAKYINNTPDLVDYLPTFFSPDSATDVRDGGQGANRGNYGLRLSGWITVPTTTNYVVFIAGDDQCVAYLSTDATPGNKKAVCFEPVWNNPRNFSENNGRRDPGSNTGFTTAIIPGGAVANVNRSDNCTHNYSAPGSRTITLQAGQSYYIEAVMANGGGGNHVAVAMAPVVNGAVTIPATGTAMGGAQVSNWINPDNVLTITSHPGNATAWDNVNTTFSVNYTSTLGAGAVVSFQWQRKRTNDADFVNLSGATARTLTVTPDARFDNGAQYRIVITYPIGKTATSNPATLTVNVPRLNVLRSGSDVVVWYTNVWGATTNYGITNWVLQSATNLTPTVNWTNDTNGIKLITVTGQFTYTNNYVKTNALSPNDQMYWRLRK